MSTFLFSLYFFLLVSKSDQAPCVKGKLSVKYDSGVISLDELVHEKSEVKQSGRPRTVVSVSTNPDSESKSPTPILCYMLHVSNVLYVTSYYTFLAVFVFIMLNMRVYMFSFPQVCKLMQLHMLMHLEAL